MKFKLLMLLIFIEYYKANAQNETKIFNISKKTIFLKVNYCDNFNFKKIKGIFYDDTFEYVEDFVAYNAEIIKDMILQNNTFKFEYSINKIKNSEMVKLSKLSIKIEYLYWPGIHLRQLTFVNGVFRFRTFICILNEKKKN